MLNYIQIACGIIAIILIFTGLFITVKKLKKPDDNKKDRIDSIIRSTLFIIFGILFYSGTRTCTNLISDTAGDFSIVTVYLASVVEVIKVFGFIILLPAVLNMLAPKTARKEVETD
ncbi:MAG: hypothetical protein J5685_07195 [Clostridiales bacterium]|nr:hypothetical protein [Clostridiales bacterium]